MSDSRKMDEAQQRLEAVRSLRVRPERDLSLGFMREQFKREIERPHKQLATFVEPWEKLVPESLREHCRLDAYQRGVLSVTVEGSAHVYELRRLLGEGLQQALAEQGKVLLRQVRVTAGVVNEDAGG